MWMLSSLVFIAPRICGVYMAFSDIFWTPITASLVSCCEHWPSLRRVCTCSVTTTAMRSWSQECVVTRAVCFHPPSDGILRDPKVKYARPIFCVVLCSSESQCIPPKHMKPLLARICSRVIWFRALTLSDLGPLEHWCALRVPIVRILPTLFDL